ncbi:MAG: hypothetical protein IT353_14870 [Gemmatimonadaceae bacterium]|nr:hypothetical protein [Gemmatimonadaceae bacterium]
MRKPLSPLQAFAEDARLAAERSVELGNDLLLWLSVAQSADQCCIARGTSRGRAVKQAMLLLAPFASLRPTMIHDARPAPDSEVARLAERFRAAAEDMERAGCFELAFTTVSAVCRFTASQPVDGGDYSVAALAMLHLGRVARQMNDIEVAEDCYQSMLAISVRERDAPLEARGHIGLALLHDMRGNTPLSKEEYLMALRLATPFGGAYRSALQGLLTVALTQEKLADALLYGWQLHDAAADHLESRVGALGDLAGVALRAGFFDAALSGYLHARELCPQPGVRSVSIAGAMRAASHLGESERVHNLDAELLADLAAANLPHNSALCLLYAAESLHRVGFEDTAEIRRTACHEIASRFGYHEFTFKADALLTAWSSRVPAVDIAPRTAEEASEVGDPAFDCGIARLRTLSV